MMSIFNGLSKQVTYALGRILRESGLALDAYGSSLSRDIAYLQPLSRHRTIMPMWGTQPVIYDSVLIADNASLIGEVVIGDKSRIGFGVIARADQHPIRIGHNCEIGDNTVINCNITRLPTGVPQSVNIGNNVRIENECVLQSCLIDDDVTVGFRSLILDGSQLERGCVIEPNSVVPAGRLIPANQVWGGSPACFIREIENFISHIMCDRITEDHDKYKQSKSIVSQDGCGQQNQNITSCLQQFNNDWAKCQEEVMKLQWCLRTNKKQKFN